MVSHHVPPKGTHAFVLQFSPSSGFTQNQPFYWREMDLEETYFPGTKHCLPHSSLSLTLLPKKQALLSTLVFFLLRPLVPKL